MPLARAGVECPGALRADFFCVYGLDADKAIADDPARAAELLGNLPLDSRTFRALDPANAIPAPEIVTWALEYDVRALIWALGGGKGAKPEPLHVGGGVDHDALLRDMESAAAALGIGQDTTGEGE